MASLERSVADGRSGVVTVVAMRSAWRSRARNASCRVPCWGSRNMAGGPWVSSPTGTPQSRQPHVAGRLVLEFGVRHRGLVPHGGAVPEPADPYVHIRGVHGLSAALVPRLAEQATTEWPARILLLVRAAPRSSDDLDRTAPRPW